ncbi:MAG: TsgA-like MFS transporter [Francisella sp.]|jgi:TsgA-like MFS transporter
MNTHITSNNSIRNKILITIVCYLCYFFTATVVIVTGTVMLPISNYFHIPIDAVGFAFTYVNVAMWLAIFVTGYLMSRFSIKKILLIASALGILASIYTNIYPSFRTLKLMLVFSGISGGFFMAVGSYMVVHMYNDHKIRAKKLLFTDFFFSFGGVLTPIIASWLITRNLEWYQIYLVLQITAVAIFILVSLSNYSIFDKNKAVKSGSALSLKSWNKSLYFIGVAAFLFLLGQLIYVGYGPAYYEKVLGWTVTESNSPLAYFWAAQCVGLFISPIITKKIPLKTILPVFMAISTILIYFMIFTSSINIALSAAVIFGLFNCYVYAGLLAYGTFQMKTPPPTLITTILLFGTTGTALSTTLGALILRMSGSLVAVMHSVVIFYFICLIFIVLAVIYSKEQKV